jgi:hypothetical protein
MADTFDTLGDTGVPTPPRSALPLALGGLIVLALIGFYMGLNAGDHRTRLPGDIRTAGDQAGVDFSRARVAVAIAPEELAPPPPPAPEPVVTAPAAETAAAAPAPVVKAPVVEAPPPAAPVAPAPPPNLEGLF